MGPARCTRIGATLALTRTAVSHPQPRGRIIEPALLMVALMWGAGNVVTKWIVAVIDPAALFAMRTGAASILMVALMFFVPRRRLAARDWLMLLGVGGVVIAVQNLSFGYAMKMTTASEGSLLISTAPVWTAIMAAALGMELVTRLNWLGIAIALGGVAMITFGAARGDASSAPARFWGDLLMIGSSWLYGGYMVMSKRWMQRLGRLQVVCYTFAASGVVLVAVGAPRLWATQWAEVTWGHWVAIAYMTLGAGFVGIVVWYLTIGRTTASGTAVYQYLVPVVAVIGAAIFLGERLTALQMAAIVVTLIGVCLARVPPRRGAADAMPVQMRQSASEPCQSGRERPESDS